LLTSEQGVALLTPQKKSWGAQAGGEIEQGKTTSGIAPDALADMRAGQDVLFDRQKELNNLEHSNRVVELGARNKQLAMQDAQLTEQVEKQRRETAERERLIGDEKKKLDDAEQKIVSRSPDAGRLWKRKGNGALAVTALLAGINEFARIYGRTGGENNVLNIMNTAIERDLDDQASEIAADKDAIRLRKNALAERLADGEDPKFAREALRTMMLKQQQVQLEHEDTRKLLRASGVETEKASIALGQAYLEGRMKLEQLNTEKVDYKMQQARAAGSRFETPDEVAKRVTSTVGAARTVAEAAGLVPTEKQADMLYAENLKNGGSGSEPLQTAQVGGINKAMNNAKVYDQAKADIARIFDSGEEIELDPSWFTKAQPVTRFLQGDRAATEDIMGVGGAKVEDIMNKVMSSTHSEALGTLQEPDKKNIKQALYGDGKKETILRNLERMENQSLDELKTWTLSLRENQKTKLRAEASGKEGELLDRATSGQRAMDEAPDLRDR
jgi:hypothetical protein